MKGWRFVAVAGLSMLTACAWWMAGRPGLGNLDRLIFSHTLHMENDVECESCHAGVEEATDTAQAHLPSEEACMECHEREDNCSQCHTNVDKHKPRPPHVSELGFSHASHLSRTEGACKPCHADVEESDELPVGRPGMDTCLSCHNHAEDYDQARCLACHPSLRRLPIAAVAEFDHSGDWMERHGLQARVQGAHCLQCHTETTCAECHSRVPAAANVRLYPEAVERPLLHRGDWKSTHAMEARADGDSCLRCHQASNFCSECHRANAVAPGVSGARPPHPPGYSSRGGAGFHGEDARLRIETCYACHDQGAASNCVACHQVGGIGGNPHPSGWDDDWDREDATEDAMCRICH